VDSLFDAVSTLLDIDPDPPNAPDFDISAKP
jgi:hypothetical protein